ncbi:sulfatase-like hydrolase/transferase [soil metagenome]
MNILFLMADEFRFDAAGFAGNEVARTPNLDRLASYATIFNAAYAASPVCVPGRQCLATGKYPLHINCQTFDEDIAPNSLTFARHFSDHGYYTVACGKLHHRGPDQMQGWMHRIGAETALRWPEKFADRSQIGRRKWKGAEDVLQAGAGLSPLGLHDDYAVRGACDFLHMHFGGLYAVPNDIPLFLMVSLQQPHFPLLTEQPLLDYYLPKVPIYYDEPRANHPMLDQARIDVSEADVRRATAAYYGMVEQTDRRFGLVLTALEEAGQNIDDWLVVFTSDHGEMLGQHGVWEKRKFYEGSARVPLFLREPGGTSAHANHPCNLVDLFPTLATKAGLSTPPGLDGQDLFAPERPLETFSQRERNQFMIRHENLKYMHFADAPEVLFDLAADPGETRNVATDPAYAQSLAKLRQRLSSFTATCETKISG